MAVKGAVFLDKDGTLLVDVPYNVDPARMQLAPGVHEGLGLLAQTDMPLIVVSNQAGIARGQFRVADMQPMLEKLRTLFRDAGAEMAGFYYCPHHPQATVDAYRESCQCRKPAAGLLHAAALEQGVALSRSWMIGDILDDIEAGRRAGCRSVLINNGNETEWVTGTYREPQHIVDDFAQAARIIVAAVHQQGRVCG